MDNAETPSDLIARRVRQLREQRDWTVAMLAQRCADLGMPSLTAQVIYKLEGQRSKRAPRPVSVDEMLVLAYALDVAPVHLIAGFDDSAEIAVTPEMLVSATSLRAWVRGFACGDTSDVEQFWRNVPASEQPGKQGYELPGDPAAVAVAARATVDLMMRGMERLTEQAQEMAALVEIAPDLFRQPTARAEGGNDGGN